MPRSHLAMRSAMGWAFLRAIGEASARRSASERAAKCFGSRLCSPTLIGHKLGTKRRPRQLMIVTN